MEKARSFFSALTMSAAGLVWLLRGDLSLLGAAVAAAIPIAAWWLPWHKWIYPRRVFIWLSAGLSIYATVRLLADTACAFLPLWQVALGMAVFTALLLYIGKGPLRRACVLVGGVTAAGLILLCLCALPMADGGVQIRSNDLFGAAAGGLALFGGGLTALECGGEQRAARWGGIAGAGLFLLMAGTALAVWSPEALSKLEYPILSAFRRVELFNVAYCPDVAVAAILAVCALWQWSAAIGILFSLQNSPKDI